MAGLNQIMNPPPSLRQWCDKTAIKTHNKTKLDLTLEIDTENQVQIQVKGIHDTIKVFY